jgi:hypothetical protein
MREIPTWMLGIALATVPAGGCCGPLRPSPEQVQAWVDRELPAGSSRAAAGEFSALHQFSFVRGSDGSESLYRKIEGCDWKKPVVRVRVTYDRNDRIDSTAVDAAALGMP